MNRSINVHRHTAVHRIIITKISAIIWHELVIWSQKFLLQNTPGIIVTLNVKNSAQVTTYTSWQQDSV